MGLIISTLERAQVEAMILLKQTSEIPGQQVSTDHQGSFAVYWGHRTCTCSCVCPRPCVFRPANTPATGLLQAKIRTCIQRLFQMERTLLKNTKVMFSQRPQPYYLLQNLIFLRLSFVCAGSAYGTAASQC